LWISTTDPACGADDRAEIAPETAFGPLEQPGSARIS
jgi:hypothetical protein